ncbi:MAG: YbaK/EbsC family protein [Thermoanaerobaculia bacterium]
MPARKVREYLDRAGIRYVTISHSPAFTAQEIAASAHIKGKDLAKTVMIQVDDRIVMAVVPASKRLDLDQIGERLGARSVTLASEDAFQRLFPEIEPGAMPPFGNLYDMDVLVDTTLTEDEQIAFNAGSHTELIKMAFDDYRRVVQPKVMELTRSFARV